MADAPDLGPLTDPGAENFTFSDTANEDAVSGSPAFVVDGASAAVGVVNVDVTSNLPDWLKKTLGTVSNATGIPIKWLFWILLAAAAAVVWWWWKKRRKA
jgi:hypothetical protein